MTQWHLKSKRKASGGLRTTMRRSDKRLAWKGGEPSNTTIAASQEGVDRRPARKLGRGLKVKLKRERSVNVNAKDGKVRQFEIITVAENRANRQFARNNIITKGAVLECRAADQKVFVKVTNRPGQQGTIQGVILGEFVREKDLKAEKTGKSEKKKKASGKTPEKPEEEPKIENK